MLRRGGVKRCGSRAVPRCQAKLDLKHDNSANDSKDEYTLLPKAREQQSRLAGPPIGWPDVANGKRHNRREPSTSSQQYNCKRPAG